MIRTTKRTRYLLRICGVNFFIIFSWGCFLCYIFLFSHNDNAFWRSERIFEKGREKKEREREKI